MATEECAICGDSVPFATTTHVLVNPKHEDGVADHYVCRPCYDEHLEGLFAALAEDEDRETPLDVDVEADGDVTPEDDEVSNGGERMEGGTGTDDAADEPLDASPE